MARPRTKDPLLPLLDPIARRFTAEVAAAVQEFVETRVKQEAQRLVDRAFANARGRGAGGAAGAVLRATNMRPCRVPGCGKMSKGPRFDYFCEVHRALPAAEKDAVKAGKGGAPAAPPEPPAAPAGRKAVKAPRGKASARK